MNTSAASSPVDSASLLRRFASPHVGSMFATALSGLLPANSAHAAHLACVATSAELQDALTIAQSNGEEDDIRITQGVFPAPEGGFHAVVTESDVATALNISGSWLPGCTDQAPEPRSTMLSGEGTRTVLRFDFDTPVLEPSGPIALSALAIANGSHSIGALQFHGERFTGLLHLDRLEITRNNGEISAGFYITTSGKMLFKNSLVVGNTSDLYRPAGSIIMIGIEPAALLNNTFSNNIGPHYRAIDLSTSYGVPITLQNNIFSNGADGVTTQSIVCAGSQAASTTMIANHVDAHSCAAATVLTPSKPHPYSRPTATRSPLTVN